MIFFLSCAIINTSRERGKAKLWFPVLSRFCQFEKSRQESFCNLGQDSAMEMSAGRNEKKIWNLMNV